MTNVSNDSAFIKKHIKVLVGKLKPYAKTKSGIQVYADSFARMIYGWYYVKDGAIWEMQDYGKGIKTLNSLTFQTIIEKQ